MLSSDSGSDDEQYTFVPHESIKDVLTIIHKGKPPKEPQAFAMGSNKKIYWPPDLWNSGTLIYSIENPKVNLKPPVTRSDKIIRFNSRFESGNLSLAYQLAPDTYHLILEYDKNKSGSCQWFYFQMTNVRKDIKYSFYISGFHKATSVDHGGLKVFWYSEKRAKEKGISWSRGGYNYEYGVTLRDASRKRASLQFKISFPYDRDTIYLCYALPYTYSELQRNILNWKKNHFSIFSSTTLCQTLGGRDCPLLTITSPKNIAENNKNYLFFTARVHPGESNGSFVIHGLIDFLLSDHPAAKYLVDKYVIKIVPMLNIDGVVEGFYRIGLSGVDLNRVWTNPNPTLHPVITATKNLVKDLTKNGNVAVYIDFHGHSRLNGSFAYGCPNNISPTKDDIFLNCDKSLINTEKLLPRIISYLSDAFSWGSCQFSYPKERKTASRIVIRKELGIVQSFTIESSFGGIISGPRAGVLYDELIWKELGSKCGEGVYHMITKKTSPLASYVEKEIKLITPNCCICSNENNDNDNNSNSTQEKGKNEETEKNAEKNHQNDHQPHKLKENLFSNLDSLQNEININDTENQASKSTKKAKKKGTGKKKKAATTTAAAATTTTNNSELKIPDMKDMNFNINIMPIDEFSNLLNKIVNNSVVSSNNNTSTSNNHNKADFLVSDSLNKTAVSHPKKSKKNVHIDEKSSPDAPINPVQLPPASAAKKEGNAKDVDHQKTVKKKSTAASSHQSSVKAVPKEESSHPPSKIVKKSPTKKESASSLEKKAQNENDVVQKTAKKAKPVQKKETASTSEAKNASKENDHKQNKTINQAQNQGQIQKSDQKSEKSQENGVDNNASHNHDDIELDYLNQRRAGKFGPSTIFRMAKPINNLIVNSQNISLQSPGCSVPKWVNIQFSKR